MATTMLEDLLNPQVLKDMIDAKLPAKIVVTPFCKVDTTLQGRAGDTVTIPQYKYIGDAEDVAEGVACGTVKLEYGTTQAKIKKAMKGVELTDEAVLSGYGDPQGQATSQLAKAIASKLDNDALEAISAETVQLKFDGSANVINYEGIVDAVDVFEEEVNSEKVMFVHPKQITQIRKDPNFISADKYDGKVMMSGEIGKVANVRIVPSKKVKTSGTNYLNPIIKLSADNEAEDDAPALTIYLKRDTNLETQRDTLARKTILSVDKIYGVAISNTGRVLLAKFAKVAPVSSATEPQG